MQYHCKLVLDNSDHSQVIPNSQPQPQTISSLFLVPVGLPFSGHFHVREITLCIVFCVWLLSLTTMFEVHPCCGMH